MAYLGAAVSRFNEQFPALKTVILSGNMSFRRTATLREEWGPSSADFLSLFQSELLAQLLYDERVTLVHKLGGRFVKTVLPREESQKVAVVANLVPCKL